MDCHRCELRDQCNNVVWGRGPISSKIMFVAEAPSDEDELMQEPFVSREGKHVRALIQRAGITEFYLTYAVKCYSKIKAKTRSVKACRYWLDKEIAGLKPTAIVTLGSMPTSLLLKEKPSLSSVLGSFQRVESIVATVCPWHSAHKLLQSGRGSDDVSVQFFKSVWESVNAEQFDVSSGVAASDAADKS